jgi:outer membrane protein OmpA-like peptidoglycan-associated protein
MSMQRTTLAALAVALAASGCANMSETQKGTATGAGIGAAVGTVIGVATAGGNTGRSAATGAAVGAGLGALGGYVWSKKMEDQKKAMEQASQGTGIAVNQTADNRIKVNIPADAGFDVGRSDIRPSLRNVLDKFAGSMNEHSVTSMQIVGHTDSTGTDAINNPLSVARAQSTRDYLAGRGVATQRMAIDGRGSREPVAPNDNDSGRAANRRVEIYIAEAAPRQ